MAGSVNKVILVGNVGRDPEIRQSADGKKIANLSIATSESWKDRNTGERQEKTEWHRVVVFNQGLADIIDRYVKKGSKLYIEGALQTRKWTDNSGIEKYTTEVVLSGFKGELTLLDNKGGSSSSFGDSSNSFGGSQASSSGWDSNPASSNAFDDEIPF